MPRLGRFNELHPDIELAIDPNSKLADFRSGEADVGMRYGPGGWDDVEALKLTDAVIFPVAAPDLLGGPQEPQARRSRRLQPAA